MVIESMLLVEFIRAGLKRQGAYTLRAEQLESVCGPPHEIQRSEWFKRVQIFAHEYGWQVRVSGNTVEFLPRSAD